MAMLAEPRRKQRIGPNPRGKFYSEQEDNFGKVLLKKMGWNAGEGLGLQRQGISEAIRPKIQMSSKGLGYDPKTNPWVEHNREFEEILKNLKQETDAVVTTDPVDSDANKDQDAKRKLEEKSKKSRARIHYHKFVKGKDLSRASSEDLKSIFGNSNPEDTPSSLEVTNASSADKHSSDVAGSEEKEANTVNRGSMVDYFKQKIEEKRIRLSVTHEVLVPANAESQNPPDNPGASSDARSEKRKKKKRLHQSDEEVEGATEANTVKIPAEEQDEGNTINRGSMVDYFKQKMEERRLRLAAAVDPTVTSVADIQSAPDDCSTSPAETKKKRKKKRKRSPIDAEDAGFSAILETGTDGNHVISSPASEEVPRKKKKKSKHDCTDQQVPAFETMVVPAEELGEVKIEKKSKKKKRQVQEAQLGMKELVVKGERMEAEVKNEDKSIVAAVSGLSGEFKLEQASLKEELKQESEETSIADIQSLPDDCSAFPVETKKRKKKKRSRSPLDAGETGFSAIVETGTDENHAINSLVSEAPTVEPLVVPAQEPVEVKIKKKSKKKKMELQEELGIGEVVAKAEVEGDTEKEDRNSVAAFIQRSSECKVEPPLEEQLKKEMEKLKQGKTIKKAKYFSSLQEVTEKFKGSNINKINGYSPY